MYHIIYYVKIFEKILSGGLEVSFSILYHEYLTESVLITRTIFSNDIKTHCNVVS